MRQAKDFDDCTRFVGEWRIPRTSTIREVTKSDELPRDIITGARYFGLGVPSAVWQNPADDVDRTRARTAGTREHHASIRERRRIARQRGDKP